MYAIYHIHIYIYILSYPHIYIYNFIPSMTPLMAALIPHSRDQPHINLAELEDSRHPIEMLQYMDLSGNGVYPQWNSHLKTG